MAEPLFRFVLTDAKENEIKHGMVYEMFEPTVHIVIRGDDAFERLGAKGASPVVIMVFLENALPETLSLVRDYEESPEGEGEYEYWFDGTGCGLTLRRRGHDLSVFLDVDWGFGPVDLKAGIYHIGTITVRDWVEALVVLAKDLIEKYRKLNPQVYKSLKDMELQVQEIESWLVPRKQ